MEAATHVSPGAYIIHTTAHYCSSAWQRQSRWSTLVLKFVIHESDALRSLDDFWSTLTLRQVSKLNKAWVDAKLHVVRQAADRAADALTQTTDAPHALMQLACRPNAMQLQDLLTCLSLLTRFQFPVTEGHGLNLLGDTTTLPVNACKYQTLLHACRHGDAGACRLLPNSVVRDNDCHHPELRNRLLAPLLKAATESGNVEVVHMVLSKSTPSSLWHRLRSSLSRHPLLLRLVNREDLFSPSVDVAIRRGYVSIALDLVGMWGVRLSSRAEARAESRGWAWLPLLRWRRTLFVFAFLVTLDMCLGVAVSVCGTPALRYAFWSLHPLVLVLLVVYVQAVTVGLRALLRRVRGVWRAAGPLQQPLLPR